MNIVLDIVLVLIVLIGLILGWKRGFVGVVAKPVKFAASLALAIGACNEVSSKLIYPNINAPITNYVRNFLYENCSGITGATASDELPTVMKLAAAIFDIDIEGVANGASGSVIDAIAEELTGPVVNVVSVVLSFIAIFIVANIVIALALWLVNAILKKGLLGVLNRILGTVFAVAFAFIISWAFASLFSFVIHTPAMADASWVKDFEGGFVYNFLNEYNPIELLLSF